MNNKGAAFRIRALKKRPQYTHGLGCILRPAALCTEWGTLSKVSRKSKLAQNLNAARKLKCLSPNGWVFGSRGFDPASFLSGPPRFNAGRPDSFKPCPPSPDSPQTEPAPAAFLESAKGYLTVPRGASVSRFHLSF